MTPPSTSTSSFEPLRREKLSETVAARLREQILSGRLQLGDRLPGHRDLATAFSVGMSSVREAISILVSEGLVETHAGKGTYVRDLPGPTLSLTGRSRLTHREIEEVTEAREVLELHLATAAAERASPDDIRVLREKLTEMAKVVDDAEAYAAADLRLHLAIATAAHNRFLLDAMEQLGELLRRTMEVSFTVAARSPGNLQISVESHRRLVDCIETGDVDGTRQVVTDIMSRHHENVLGPDSTS